MTKIKFRTQLGREIFKQKYAKSPYPSWEERDKIIRKELKKRKNEEKRTESKAEKLQD
jgi:hypothetical protein|tara:strand:- start:141 stop:314 length:174 start_codon:yes stop_codon:yes gene_type:complete